MKKLNRILRQDRERFFVPRSAQAVIPIQTIWEDSIFMLNKPNRTGLGKYAVTYKFEDINYDVASPEDKDAMFRIYSGLLNSFDSGATYKITILVKKLDKEEFKRSILIPLKGDTLYYQTMHMKYHLYTMLDKLTYNYL